MNAEYIQVLINKISTIYTEQIWAVTIFSAMCGFIINKSKCLIETLERQVLKHGIQGAAVLCAAFIIIRFIAYIKYNNEIDIQLVASGIHPITNLPTKYIALFSGTIFYLIIVFLLSWVTIKIIDKVKSQ